MKAIAIIIFSAILLASCGPDGGFPSMPESRPVKANHYNFITGEKIAEQTYQYDSNKRLVYETYADLVDHNSDTETFYEYDSDGNVIRKRARIMGSADLYSVIVTTFIKGVKAKDSTYTEGATEAGWTKMEYYYNGDFLADSARMYGLIAQQESGIYLNTFLYTYDQSGQLLLESITDHVHPPFVYNQYSYIRYNLVLSCREGNCLKQEYNQDDQVIKTTMIYGGTISRVTEEYFYKDQLLAEKKLYLYDTYDLNDSYTRVTQVKYEY